jgi:periplasmic divalent cation tolerance protein
MTPMTDAVLVLTTLGGQADVPAFARVLVDARLAACVSLLPPMTSIYRWKEGVEQAQEQPVVIKTTRARLDALRVWMAVNHPYEVPEFLVLPVAEGGDAYLAWLRESVR